MIRAITQEDFEQLSEIWEKFYKNEFEFPDFIDKYLCAFVVTEDKDDKIICVCGIRTIAEAIVLTNLHAPLRKRYKAFAQILTMSSAISENNGYDQLHAFVQDKNWEDILINHAKFKYTKGNSLVLNLR